MSVHFKAQPKKSLLDQAMAAQVAAMINPLVGLDNVDRTKIENNPEMQRQEMERCAKDAIYFAENYVWCYDPRLEPPNPRESLFKPYERQKEMIVWANERRAAKEIGAIKKARDSGVSIVFGCVLGLQSYLFEPGSTIGYGSYQEDKLDRLGDMSSLFEKIRFCIRRLPEWMKPKGFNEGKHLLHKRIINPANGSVMIAEVGDQCGRGGRCTWYAADEAGFLEHPDLVEASLVANTNVIYYISTPNGLGNFFARKCMTLPEKQVFEYHYAQPLDAKILTPTGWKAMGDIAVGDQVIGSDGKATEVTMVFPQGDRSIFRVSFNDGASTECTTDHLWSVLPYGNHRREREHITRVLPLSEISQNYASLDSRGYKINRYQVPLAKPVQFNASGILPIHPYVLGCLLGDGTFPTKSSKPIQVAIGNDSIEMVDLIGKRLPIWCSFKHYGDIKYRISAGKQCRGGPKGRGLHNPVNESVRNLGLSGKQSHNKFIPECYKLSSPEDRLELLQGLMDTDGSVAKSNPGTASYVSISRQLVDDVVFVAQSLGGTAKVYTHEDTAGLRAMPQGRMCMCQVSYQVDVRLPTPMVPFKLKRKTDVYKHSQKYHVRRSITGIDAAGVKQCQCIKVEAKDGLYLTDHCIVTHNSHDPRKTDEWKAKIIRDFGTVVFEREYNLNFAASLEGICIPADWVRAAVNLPLPPIGDVTCGFDVAAEGDNFNVMAMRQGPLVKPLLSWKDMNTTQSAHVAAKHAADAGATQVFFDSIGVGAGIRGTWDTMVAEQGGEGLPFEAIPVVGGEAPSDTIWPDGKKSKDKFVNVRAEMYWLARTRFEKTYEYVQWLADNTKGACHPLDELISIPNDQQLIFELSTPLISYGRSGKIQIEGKMQMKARGVKSPDRADALIYSMYPKGQKRKMWFV